MIKNSYLLLILCLMLLTSCGNKIPQFDGKTAYGYLEEQCALGARPPGSEELQLCREYIKSRLSSAGAGIRDQEFIVEAAGKEIKGVNIIAEFYPQMSRRILLGAHYDTRPWSDKDEDQANHAEPVLGANDGASGVAVLLEIARLLGKSMPPEMGVDMVFFDLEDSGQYQDSDSWCLGSSYFAEHYEGNFPEKAIIVDMIGDIDLEIPIEYNSYHNSPLLVREVWDAAEKAGAASFVQRIDHAIEDDHLPLIRIGMNAIDIIDFDYQWWHTVHDSPDKCSPASLQQVGQVLVNIIYQ